MRAKGGIWLGSLAGLFWCMYMIHFAGFGDSVTPDSASYVECAKNIALGRGCLITPWSEISATRWQTMGTFPPGYSMLMAPWIAMGLDPIKAGLAVSIVSGALFLVVLGVLVWSLLPPILSIAVVALVFSMPPLWTFGSSTNSDIPFLMVAAVSLLAMILATQDGGMRLGWLFGGGLAAGAAYLIRNAGVSLIGAEGLYLLFLAWSWKAPGRVRAMAAWIFGVCATAVPLVLRNWIVFRTTVPYSMPPSEKGFVENLKEMTAVVITDLIGTKHAGNLAEQSILIAVLGIIFAAGVTFFYVKRGPRPVVLLVLYANLYTLMILVWRTRYHAENIGSRYMLQIYWILWVVLALSAAALYAQPGPKLWWRRAGLLASFILLLGAHARPYFQAETGDHPLTSPDLKSSVKLLQREVPEGQLVVSTSAYYLRLAGGLNARQAPEVSDQEPSAQLTHACQSGLLWGFHIDRIDEARRGDFGSFLQLLADPDARVSGLERVQSDARSIIMKCNSRFD